MSDSANNHQHQLHNNPTTSVNSTVPDDSWAFHIFQIRNAKVLAALLIFIATVYHGFLKFHYKEDTCVGLLEDGRYQGQHVWQPYGCMLHKYSQADMRMCFKYQYYWGRSNWIILIGDQNVWNLYKSLVNQIAPRPLDFPSHPPSSATDTSSSDKQSSTQSNNKYTNTDLNLTIAALNASLNAAGGSMNFLEELEHNLTVHLRPVIRLARRSSVRLLWMSAVPVDESKLQKLSLLTKSEDLQNQTDQQNEKEGKCCLLNNVAIKKLNDVVEKVLGWSEIRLWTSAHLLSRGFISESPDGVQIGPVALNYDSQILINLYCNELMKFSDGTCCSSPPRPNHLQIILLVSFVFCLCISFIVILSRCHPNSIALTANNGGGIISSSPTFDQSSVTPNQPFRFTRLAILMLFLYACDRGGFWMQENKWYTLFNFLLPIAYLAVLGLFFTEQTKNTNFMHRDQTDEWKGWMQLVFLCYHMTGAEEVKVNVVLIVLWIRMIGETLMSGYLFLLGYCHFQYFWTTGDFSLKRVFRVLFRYNLLVFLLALVMNRPYQFYQYVPLASYWFLFLYILLALPPHVTASSVNGNPLHYLFMVIKFVIFFAVISILYLSEVFFEKVFLTRPWKLLFVSTDDSITDWWLNWWAHRYAAGAGMVLGFTTNILRRYLLLSDAQPTNLFSTRLTILICFFSSLVIAVYGFVISQCRSVNECLEIHGYIGFAPLFVIQYHAWLVADAEGVLVLWPRFPVFNLIMCSFILVCLAHEGRLLTYSLISTCVPDNNPKVLLRNVIILSVSSLLFSVVYTGLL